MEPLGIRLPSPLQRLELPRHGVGGAWVVGGAGRAGGQRPTLRKSREGLAEGWAPAGAGRSGRVGVAGERSGAGRVLLSASL